VTVLAADADVDDLLEGPLPPLAGFTIAVTAARRRDELGGMLERRGARVVYAPALQIVPLADDTELLEATRWCLRQPVDITVATTGIGFRGWIEASDGWGLGEDLRRHLASGVVLARGPKARGAVRAAGLVDAWSPESESSSEVLRHLLAGDVAGKRIALQLHGEPLPDFIDALRNVGADVVPVPVYRWMPPDDLAPLQRLLDSVVARQVDAVTFTSAPAVASLLALARSRGLIDELLSALQDDVVPACVGPVTAAALEGENVRTMQPTRGRLGALVREVVAELPERRTLRIVVGAHRLEIRGHLVVVDGRVCPLTPVPMAMLRALAREPGQVVSRAVLKCVVPGEASDEHAAEMAVGRLRSALGEPGLVQTVVKRGYRLACI
jgi:uroporphyrinogen-III synthase